MDGRRSGAARRSLRGRRGGLKDLPNMPLDIIVEIFAFLHPRDLLNLARISPPFRAFLMSRSSAHLWKSARRNIEGLPDCPPYLSEPAYANLLFFPNCHVCLANNIQGIIFEFSVRYCGKCRKAMLVRYNDRVNSFVENVKKTVNVNEELFNLTFIASSKDNTIEYTYIHLPEWDAFKNAWGATIDTEERTRLVAERIASVKLVEEASGPYYQWKDAQEQNRAEEIHGVRTDRFNTLLSFLRQEGWGAELDIMREDDYIALAEKPFARKAAKLTTRTWPKISEDAHAFMANVQAIRLKKERLALLHKRFNFLSRGIDHLFYGPINVLRRPEWDMDPTFIDLALIPSIRAIWDAPYGGAVDSASANPQVVRNIAAHIHVAKQYWKETLKAQLIEELRTAVPEVVQVEDPLSLAIAGFSCTKCVALGRYSRMRAPLRFPEILAHPCARLTQLPASDIYLAAVSRYGMYGPLSLACIIIDPDMLKNLRTTIEAMGLNPLQATMDDLNNCETRLHCTCTRCQITPPAGDAIMVTVEAFDWIRALEHYNIHRRSGITAETHPWRWIALGANEAHSVRRQEARARSDPALASQLPSGVERRLGCHFCAFHCLGANAMRYHLQQHGKHVDLAQVGQHSYDHLDNERYDAFSIWVHYLNAGGYTTAIMTATTTM